MDETRERMRVIVDLDGGDVACAAVNGAAARPQGGIDVDVGYAVKPPGPDTWEAFAQLAEQHNAAQRGTSRDQRQER